MIKKAKMSQTKKIAFITVATRKYIDFAVKLKDSIESFAFTNSNDEVSFIVFSDIPKVFNKKSKRVNCKGVMTTHIPFPLISLMRYNYYSDYEELNNYDYIYHIDCDMEIKSAIGDDIIGERVCVEHPGFFNVRNNHAFPYERNVDSRAFVNFGEGQVYYQNCFQGGSKSEFINMCNILKQNIFDDLKRNKIALWHDESHMNRYMIDNPPSLVLPPTYAQPQFWQSFGETKIIHLDKNHDQIRM